VVKRALTILTLAAALFGQVGPAAAQWGPPGHGGYRGDWDRHGGPHGRRPLPPYEVIMVYPAPPSPSPQVVYVQPAPIQAVPASDPYIDGQGRYCREYQSMVVVGGQQQPSYGTACRMPDGQWRIVQ
jgi:hypothetical protein